MLDTDILDKYEMTIGVECHVQLATDTKLFSGADNDARDKSPNSVVSPIDYGLPGMLPNRLGLQQPSYRFAHCYQGSKDSTGILLFRSA